MVQNRTDVARVPIPSGICAGRLVGRGGVNTRWLHIQSGGAHVNVNDAEVIIRAKDTQVRVRALHLVRRQLEAMVKFGTHDLLSPSRFDYVLLESSFGCDPRVHFTLRTDEVTSTVVKKGKLFELAPVPRSCSTLSNDVIITRSKGIKCDPDSGRDVNGGDGDDGVDSGGAGDTDGSVDVDVDGGVDSDSNGDDTLLAEVACWVLTSGHEQCGRIAAAADDAVKPSIALWLPMPQDHMSPRDQDLAPRPATAPARTATTSARHAAGSASPEGGSAITATPTATLRFHAAAAAIATTVTTTFGVPDYSSPCSDDGSCNNGSRDGVTRGSGGRFSQLLAPAGHALAAAIRSAASQGPRFAVLKMRFHVGKHLFCNVGERARRAELSIAELEGASAGRGAYQSVFSNYVSASTVPRVTSWLTDVLGFALTDTKTTATLHVINQELNIHYSISLAMERGDDSTSTLRKVKVGGSRFHSVALLAAPHQLDLRLKLVAHPLSQQRPGHAYDMDAHSTAHRVAAAVRTEGFGGFTRSKRGLPRNRHLEYARRKTKSVYEGYMPSGAGEGGCGQRLRVSVTQVQDNKGTHFEISGCLPDVDTKLRQLLEQQRPAAETVAAAATASAAAADDSACFVPEWRRRDHSSRPASRNKRMPSSARWPDSDPDVELDLDWAVGGLTGLSDFTSQLNSHIQMVVGTAQ